MITTILCVIGFSIGLFFFVYFLGNLIGHMMFGGDVDIPFLIVIMVALLLMVASIYFSPLHISWGN